jgi:hypothetical protein
MSKKTPAAPPPPDPYKVAEAQTGANVGSAIASGVMGNINQVGPDGSTSYNQTGTYKMTGPDGKTYDIPNYTQTTSLSPGQQQLYDQQNQIGQGMNNLALGQIGKLTDHLGKPVDASGLPDVTNDFTADRARVEKAMFDRVNPQLDRRRRELETTLVNQGFQRGTEAFKNEMDQEGRNVNDANLAITERGLQEQQGLFGMSQSNRQRALSEMLSLRNQPINEITALMSGGQVSMPQYQQYNAPQIGAADVSGNVYNSAALQNNQWQTQLQNATAKQNAMIGALGGAAGMGAYGMMGGLFKK